MQNYSVTAELLPYFFKDFSNRSMFMMASYKSMTFNFSIRTNLQLWFRRKVHFLWLSSFMFQLYHKYMSQYDLLIGSRVKNKNKLELVFVKHYAPRHCPTLTLVDSNTARPRGLFVCVEVLRPSQPNGVMSSAVSLPNHTFTGQA